MSSARVSYDSGETGSISETTVMNLAITDEAFQCDDGRGNGCGRMFDGLIVLNVWGLCAGCAEDLPEHEDR